MVARLFSSKKTEIVYDVLLTVVVYINSWCSKV